MESGCSEASYDQHPPEYNNLCVTDAPRWEGSPWFVDSIFVVRPSLIGDITHEQVDPDPHGPKKQAVGGIQRSSSRCEGTLEKYL